MSEFRLLDALATCMPKSVDHRKPLESQERRQLRAALIERRLALSADIVTAWSAAVCRHLLERFPTPPGRQIGFCWPVNNEPDLRPALANWRTAGAGICLPVVVRRAAAMAFRPWSPGAPMIADRFGIPVPAYGDFVVPDVLLLPLNAFDDAGYRLGYGGGYFDRTLASIVPRPLAIGVGFTIGRVASIAPQPHDQRLDLIVTEDGVLQPQ